MEGGIVKGEEAWAASQWIKWNEEQEQRDAEQERLEWEEEYRKWDAEHPPTSHLPDGGGEQ